MRTLLVAQLGQCVFILREYRLQSALGLLGSFLVVHGSNGSIISGFAIHDVGQWRTNLISWVKASTAAKWTPMCNGKDCGKVETGDTTPIGIVRSKGCRWRRSLQGLYIIFLIGQFNPTNKRIDKSAESPNFRRVPAST